MPGAQGRPPKSRHTQSRSVMPAAVTADAPAPVAAPWVPLALTTALLLLSFLSRVQQNAVLTASFWGASAALLLWQAVLFPGWRSAVRPTLLLVAPRPQHYVQAMCQLSVYAYWGWYWRPV